MPAPGVSPSLTLSSEQTSCRICAAGWAGELVPPLLGCLSAAPPLSARGVLHCWWAGGEAEPDSQVACGRIAGLHRDLAMKLEEACAPVT